MSATVFNLGRGAVLSCSPDGTTFTPVKQLKTISFTGNQASYDTITNMDSPSAVAGGAPVDEYAPTTLAPGTAALSGVFSDVDPGQLMVAAALQSQVLLQWKLQFAPRAGQTTGFKRTFSAYVQESNGADAQFDKASTLSATLKVTGAYTDTPGSTSSGS